MPSFYTIRFEPEGRTEDFYETRGSYYLWPDGTRLDVQAASPPMRRPACWQPPGERLCLASPVVRPEYAQRS